MRLLTFSWLNQHVCHHICCTGRSGRYIPDVQVGCASPSTILLCFAAGTSAREARTLAAMSDMIPRDNALFSVTSLSDSTLAVVREAGEPGDAFNRHSSTVSWNGLQAQPSSAGALAAGNLSRSAHSQISELGAFWTGSGSNTASLFGTQPGQRTATAIVGAVVSQSPGDARSSLPHHTSSIVIHDSLKDIEGGSPRQGEAVAPPSDGSSEGHFDSVVVHDASVLMEHSGSGRSSGSGGSRAGPVGESGDEDASKKLHSVSFDMAKTRAHHRHKSSNYSRLLDYRVDEWYGAARVC